MGKNLPEVDVFDSEQNAFVQDWLTAFNRQHDFAPEDELEQVEGVIEQIQGTYNYKDHMERTK